MVRFVGKGHLNDQTPNFGQILVRHLPEKLDIWEFSFQYRMDIVIVIQPAHGNFYQLWS